jgi:hypothetical protein
LITLSSFDRIILDFFFNPDRPDRILQLYVFLTAKSRNYKNPTITRNVLKFCGGLNKLDVHTMLTVQIMIDFLFYFIAAKMVPIGQLERDFEVSPISSIFIQHKEDDMKSLLLFNFTLLYFFCHLSSTLANND